MTGPAAEYMSKIAGDKGKNEKATLGWEKLFPQKSYGFRLARTEMT